MEIIGALLVGLLSGTVGAISTGGGLISIPALIFMGLSPVQAIATTRLSALSGGLGSIWKYHKGKAIVWHYLPYFMVISVAAGIVGPKLLLHIDPDILQRLIGGAMILLLPVLLFSKGFGVAKRERHRRLKLPGFFVFTAVMLYGTMFGAGGGIFLIATLIYFFGLTVIEANATGTATWIIGTATALITYIAHGQVNFTVGIPLLIGALAGGYIGARLALQKGNAWVKGFLLVIVLASSIKLLFF